MTRHTATPPTDDSTDDEDAPGEVTHADAIRHGSFPYTAPAEYTADDIGYAIGAYYHEHVEADPTDNLAAKCVETRDDGDTRTFITEFERAGWADAEPSPAEYRLGKKWLDGLFEWINEVEPEVDGCEVIVE